MTWLESGRSRSATRADSLRADTLAGGGVVLCGAEARDARAVGRLQWAVGGGTYMGDTYLK